MLAAGAADYLCRQQLDRWGFVRAVKCLWYRERLFASAQGQLGGDVASGIINRDLFFDRLQQALLRAERNGQRLALLDLNVAMPLAAVTMLETIQLLGNSARNLATQCIDGINANQEVIEGLVERSLMLGTTLAPELGYNEAAAIAKACFKSGQTIREYCLEHEVLPKERLDKLLDVTEMTHPHL